MSNIKIRVQTLVNGVVNPAGLVRAEDAMIATLEAVESVSASHSLPISRTIHASLQPFSIFLPLHGHVPVPSIHTTENAIIHLLVASAAKELGPMSATLRSTPSASLYGCAGVVHSPQRRTYESEAIPAIATVEETFSAPAAGTGPPL